MTPSVTKIHAPFVVCLALLAAACGPTRPPPDVLGTAERFLADAREADAATFAPLELRFAEERLNLARSAMQERDYEIAAKLADESSANSELARIKANTGKLREEIEALKRENADTRRLLGDGASTEGGL